MTHSLAKNPLSKTGSNIFLVGFMGSGKTYWGKKWSLACGVDFFDLDESIEAAQKKTIVKLFEEEGEVFFRQVETSVLKTFYKTKNYIIACGGGTACFNDNMQWMNENGLTVYLSATPQYILGRVLTEQDKRPLIKNLNPAELLFFIEQKLKQRQPFYNQSKIILQVEDIKADFVPGFIPLHK